MKTGTDVVENSRFIKAVTRNNGRLRQRLFSSEELADNPGNLALAVMFSVKESVAKALGTGFDSSLSWHDITVHMCDDKVSVLLSGRALELAGGQDVFVSVTQDATTSYTFALLT